MKKIIYFIILMLSINIVLSIYTVDDIEFTSTSSFSGSYTETADIESVIGSGDSIGNSSINELKIEFGYFTSNTTISEIIIIIGPLQIQNLTHLSNTSSSFTISFNYTDPFTAGVAFYLNNIYNSNVTYPTIIKNITGLSSQTTYNITAIAYNGTGVNIVYNWTNSTENNILITTSSAPPETSQRNVIRRILTDYDNNNFCRVYKINGEELCINETDYNNSLQVNTFIRYSDGIIKILI